MINEKILRKARAVLDAHNNTPHGLVRDDVNTILEALLTEQGAEISGTGVEVIEYYLTANDPDAFCRLFYAIVGCSFEDYLTKCEEALASNEEHKSQGETKTMFVDYGYGAVCTNITWNKNAAEKLVSQFTGAMRQCFESELEYYRSSHPKTSEKKFAPIFVDEYENGLFLWNGMLGVICDTINENEFQKRQVFRVSDIGNSTLYVSAEIPEDDVERQEILTKQQIRAILTKYLTPLVKGDVSFDNVAIVEYN